MVCSGNPRCTEGEVLAEFLKAIFGSMSPEQKNAVKKRLMDVINDLEKSGHHQKANDLKNKEREIFS